MFDALTSRCLERGCAVRVNMREATLGISNAVTTRGGRRQRGVRSRRRLSPRCCRLG